MGKIEISFQYPWFLLLLILIPISWWIGAKSLSGLGPVRKILALLLRSAVLALIVSALAGIQWVWLSERQTVIYLLDQSDSIPIAKRQLMLDYAINSVKNHRRQNRFDRAGLIVFGREAAIEIPPLDENFPPLSKVEGYFGKSDATNLEGAIKLAQASFLEDSAKRIVILTDGNQTIGSAEAAAKRLAETGVGIDVIPVRLDTSSEILVEKIDIPGFVREGQTVDARVVIHRYTEPGSEGKDIDGRLRVVRRIGNQVEVMKDLDWTLDREINVVPLSHRIETKAGYTYEAEFIPNDKSEDTISQNNRATAFTYAQGKGRVMLIEDANNPGNYDMLIDALRRSDIEVDVRNTSNLFSSLIELQSYDSVILAGVPRSSGDDVAKIVSITDDQIEMLVQSTHEFGLGIIMLGGPEAFGAGGWTNSKLETAMPVNFSIKNKKIDAVGALAMLMHASEMAEGNYWQKMIGKAALEALGPQDYCGVLHYDMSGDSWLWNSSGNGFERVSEKKAMMRTRINRMTPGDMPAFDSSMKLAIKSLKSVQASVKHMIVISDGDPTPTSNAVLADFVNAKIKVSTVAVGAHGTVGTAELKRIATKTGGNYYVVTNAAALPKIFMREARTVARPLVYEPEGGVSARINMPGHEVMSGIPDSLPRLTGYVLTERKENPLVEVPLLATKPNEPEVASVLATWTYGLGRTAVFTTDAGSRWAADWVESPYYDQFFSQLVRWSMRPSNDDGKFNISTNVKDGRVQVVVTALDNDDKFLNFLEINASAMGPDLKQIPMTMHQQGPGRYVGELTPNQAGSYMLSVVPGGGRAPLTTGFTVPFSDEYRVRQANMRLLENLASQRPQGGKSGVLSDPLESDSIKELLGLDTYRTGIAPARSLKDIWPLTVLIGATLFFGDVFVRRVAVDLGAPLRLLASRLRRNRSTEVDKKRQASLDRLRSSKSQISDDLDRARAATTFEAQEGIDVDSSAASEAFAADASKPKTNIRQPDKPTMQVEEDASYTSRLLEAKRKAKKNNP